MEAKNELQRNAIVEARRKELETYQRALDVQWLNSRMEDGRMGRCLALIRREAEMEKDFQERTDHAAIVNARADKEIALGIEIAKVRQEEDCRLLRRHYLRERDPSLRQLAKKLQAGYVCRDLKQQILHNEYRKLQEQAEEKRANNILLTALYNDQEAKEREDTEKMQRNTQYCKELQQQLVSRQLERQCLYEDTLIEKKMLEEIMRTISDEDQRELKQKREQMEKTRQEMETSKRAREAWRDHHKRALVEEERRLETDAKLLADRDAAVVAERERKRLVKEELNEKISAKILADEAARKEREDIIKLLQEQEYLERNVQDDIAERDKLARVRTDTSRALHDQMDTKKRQERDQRAVEAGFRLQCEEKMAADDEKEREMQRKLKEKGRQYGQELLEQISENSRRRKMEQEEEEARAQYVWDCDKGWRGEVAMEREKMVSEHAPPVLGYLQAASLAPGDLTAVRAGCSQRDGLATLDVGALLPASRSETHSKCNAQCRLIRDY